ncbi:CDP-alcohol phosphatidyltransferase family protein [Agromyces sp. MMS17-SY077]|uniref:CDP-alcohol phosphatidyltransferase family protein n=1 Tax=Agromyces seonyuensis TaxID=2662446 RepID=A0A6I4NYV6_9MICO|nr:CDP-alcohol phosphatidyltransferase family protein [Agromyces seonyuensis]
MWTVPNALSLLRLLLVPVFLALIVQGSDVAALVVLVIASLTDLADGWIARRFGQVTRLGQLLDPAADRLYILAALIGFAVRGLVPWWIFVVIVGRDVMLIVLGVILARHGYGPPAVHRLGKIATFALFCGVPLMLLAVAVPATAAIAEPVGWAVTLWGAFLYWWSGIVYAVETARSIRIPVGGSSSVSDTLE